MLYAFQVQFMRADRCGSLDCISANTLEGARKKAKELVAREQEDIGDRHSFYWVKLQREGVIVWVDGNIPESVPQKVMARKITAWLRRTGHPLKPVIVHEPRRHREASP